MAPSSHTRSIAVFLLGLLLCAQGLVIHHMATTSHSLKTVLHEHGVPDDSEHQPAAPDHCRFLDTLTLPSASIPLSPPLPSPALFTGETGAHIPRAETPPRSQDILAYAPSLPPPA
jgi:hypothetical protein